MKTLQVVVGGQYGSEGKGAVVAHLARSLSDQDLVIRVGGPNAGHTVVDDRDRTWKLRQIPASAPVSQARVHIAAGSEVDLAVLRDEIEQFRNARIDIESMLSISPHATLLEDMHQRAEAGADLTGRIGSTSKGIGAARAARLWRTAETVGGYAKIDGIYSHLVREADPFNYRHVIVEGTQGYGLGLHTDRYPFTTSGDCTAVDFLSQAQISPWTEQLTQVDVWVVARVHPIRVAGNSGPLLGETTWEKLNLPAEHTTVTNKVRRVGAWDPALLASAVKANGGHPVVKIALTMVDHLQPQVAGMTKQEELEQHFDVTRFIEQVEQECNALVGLVGTGPSTMVQLEV